MYSRVKAPSPLSPKDRLPLALDLDGTLLKTDTLAECALAHVRASPWGGLALLAWAAKGRANLKRNLAQYAKAGAPTWPANEAVLAYARSEADGGRLVVLATAADYAVGEEVRRRFPFISQVFASDGHTNLKGNRKAAALADAFPNGFVYAGNDRADVPVWRASASVIGVGRGASLAERCGPPVEASFPSDETALSAWLRSLRLHQWIKNILLFIPMILGGRALEGEAWIAAIAMFLALGLMASGTYQINDLIDLSADRRHWSKHKRPLASGELSIRSGVASSIVMVMSGLALSAASFGLAGILLMLGYLLLTLAYSFALKRVAILDAFVIGFLFSARLAIGMVVTRVETSAWLLVFACFLFTSLTFAKRTVELLQLESRGVVGAEGRGYVARDAAVTMALGVAGSVASVLVLTLYIVNDAFQQTFFGATMFLWTAPILLGIWVGRIWLVCWRGELTDDPIVFAIRDPASRLLGALAALSALIALIRVDPLFP